MGKGNSFSNGDSMSNGTGNSGPSIVNLLHGPFCACRWCLMGHKS